MSRGEQCVYKAMNGMEQRRAAAKLARQSMLKNRLQPDHEWISTESAEDLLNTSSRAMNELAGCVRRKSRSANGSKCQAVGSLWYRADLERLLTIRRECRLGWQAAGRVLRAEREGRL